MEQGTRFSKFLVLELIGQGAMACIYRARDEFLLRDVALKVMTPGAFSGEEAVGRFLQEARIAASIEHPHVVDIFDIGVHDGSPFIAMAHLVGEDLDARLRRDGVVPESTLVDLVLPVVAGIVAVHDAGVVHRDLKPSNIFLARGYDGDIIPKLLDFGISKNTRQDLRLTGMGKRRWLGTPLYSSPEALRGDPVTHLSDQYAFGVLLYECATGINPFESDSLGETFDRITSGAYTRVSEQATHPSRSMIRVIERTMSLDPARRFADMRELGRNLLVLAGRRTRLIWSKAFDERSPGAASASVDSERRSGYAAAVVSVESRPSNRLLRRVGIPVFTTCCTFAATYGAWHALRERASPAHASSAALAAPAPPPAPQLAAPVSCPGPAMSPCSPPSEGASLVEAAPTAPPEPPAAARPSDGATTTARPSGVAPRARRGMPSESTQEHGSAGARTLVPAPPVDSVVLSGAPTTAAAEPSAAPPSAQVQTEGSEAAPASAGTTGPTDLEAEFPEPVDDAPAGATDGADSKPSPPGQEESPELGTNGALIFD